MNNSLPIPPYRGNRTDSDFQALQSHVAGQHLFHILLINLFYTAVFRTRSLWYPNIELLWIFSIFLWFHNVTWMTSCAFAISWQLACHSWSTSCRISSIFKLLADQHELHFHCQNYWNGMESGQPLSGQAFAYSSRTGNHTSVSTRFCADFSFFHSKLT